MKKLTIHDIAKLAGVGKSTVSRVLTNDPKVKPDTRHRVEKIISDSGYVPSKSAQSMRGGRQKVVGVIISRLDSPSENKAVGSILDTFYASGYDVVIMESQFDTEKTNDHLDVLKKRNVDGIIVFGFTGCDVARLIEWGNKIVVIAMDVEGISSIDYDNKGVIFNALEELKRNALSNIVYIGVDINDKSTGEIRLNAYIEWCKNNGVVPHYSTGQLSYESAYQQVDSVLTAHTQAIVCASDTLALGVIKRLHELSRGDVSVTGVGGNQLLSFLFPNTFSVDPGYEEAGRYSANMLISQLLGDQAETHITQIPIK